MEASKEISVLKFINSEGNTTQREIAKLTGMSLGKVNSIIKGLIIKGYILKYSSNERVVQYLLTSEGKKHKSVAFYEDYSTLITKYNFFQKRLEVVIWNYCIQKNLRPILVGIKDDILLNLENTLSNMKVSFEVMTINDLYSNIGDMTNKIAIIWHLDYIDLLNKLGIEFIHIFEEIEKLNKDNISSNKGNQK